MSSLAAACRWVGTIGDPAQTLAIDGTDPETVVRTTRAAARPLGVGWQVLRHCGRCDGRGRVTYRWREKPCPSCRGASWGRVAVVDMG
jgi:hypothetical protein